MQEIRLYSRRGEFVESIVGDPISFQAGDIIESVRCSAAKQMTYIVYSRVWDMNLPVDKRFKLIVQY